MQFDLVKIFQEIRGFQLFVVLALLAMAVASFAVVVERTWVFWRSRRHGRAFAAIATPLLQRRDHSGLLKQARAHPRGHLSRLLGAGIRVFLDASRAPDSRVAPAELARRELDRQREVLEAELRRGFGVLASTGSVAPFVGLLGTVVGIITAFQGIAREGSGGLGAVSSGIAEALVVTALGLLVAIPSVLLFNALSTRVEGLLLALDQAASQLVDHLEAGVELPSSDANGRADDGVVNGARALEGETLAEA